MELKQAVKELRKNEKKKFDQGVDLIINLKGIDIKKDNIVSVINIPNKIKDKRVCGFLTTKSSLVKSILQPDFAKYKDKKELKNLVKNFDFFIASAKLMPLVATTFGKVLGPTGKMPSPQLGVLMQEDDANIKNTIDRINKSIKIRVKESSVKVLIGKESMSDEQIADNVQAAYQELISALPNKKENVKSVMIKLTMSKPVVVEIK
ncbi:hypothetical protein COU54_05390 [Candidatus Pacearchaeota archaeon CG10_big_fil_rev_8_21_14_0_10_31_24]|nr:MAG: hypothetical protein COU54_05390 [Candidatus Pacearchaeota archaeon CG10_big_fil_rev_8_21_14_0_10_31_24]